MVTLCFVHIDIQGKRATYSIPPAISDRMLVEKILYPYILYDATYTDFNIGYAVIDKHEILCYSTYDKGYLNVYFPIDSNK